MVGRVSETTERVHLINIKNSVVVIAHKSLADNGVDHDFINFSIPCYAEFDKAAIDKKYGYETTYNGLIVIDGLQDYVSENNYTGKNNYWTVSIGDKITDHTIEDYPLYVVQKVSEFFDSKGRFCSLEILV